MILLDLVYLLINPMTWIVGGGLLVVVLLLFKCSRRKAADRNSRKFSKSAMVAVLWIVTVYFISTPWVPHAVSGWLEDDFNVISAAQLEEISERSDVRIVVLGYGYYDVSGLPAYMRFDETGVKRMLEGARLARLLPQAGILTSGYSNRSTLANSEMVKQALIAQGINESRIDHQPEPENTEEEAKWYIERYGTDETVVLVTSATHMRRSIAWFKLYGVNSLYPAPTDFRAFQEHSQGWTKFVPNPRHVETLHKALHEFAGAVLVRRTDTASD